jgi:glutamate dehydrogenase
MAARNEAIKTKLLDDVALQVRKKAARADAANAEAFARQFYAHVAPDDIVTTPVEDLAGSALAMWRLLRKRTPGKPTIAIYNPRLDRHGWMSPHTAVEIVNDDMPFLVDSVVAELNRHDLAVHLLIHPIVEVVRDTDGNLVELAAPGSGRDDVTLESAMHLEVDEQRSSEALKAIVEGLEKVLTDVRMAVADWKKMRGKVIEAVAALDDETSGIADSEIDEARVFLKWLDEDNFTFLGYREYETVGADTDAHMEVMRDSGLGILRDSDVHLFEGVRRLADLPDEVRAHLQAKQILIVNKANMRSTVHRPVYLDAIGVKRFDTQGRVVGERLFAGLFTSTVYSRSPRYIPLLRRKIERMVARAKFKPNSHDGKALLHILETFPRDELFQSSEQELFDVSLGVLHLQERQRIALFMRYDPFQRFVSCLIYVPRDRYSTDLRLRFQAIIEEALDGPVTAFYTQIADDSVLARVQFLVKTMPGKIPNRDPAEIEERLVEAGRTWADDLRDALVRAEGEERGLHLLRLYGEAFPTGYRERFSAKLALIDIDNIEAITKTETLGLNLYRPPEALDAEMRFKVYNRGAPVALSDVLPMLENMGLRVLEEVPYRVDRGDHVEMWIHDFGVMRDDGSAIELREVRELFQEAFARVWTGEGESDGFNKLVLGAGLGWRQVMMLRAFAKYLRQAGIPFSQDYMEETLAANHELARLIVALFIARFDPEDDDRDGREKHLLEEIEKGLDGVANLDQDRIIRRFVNVVQSALRTNYFQDAAEGPGAAPDAVSGAKPYFSFKLDSQKVDELPLPRPCFEIFVYAPRTEGIHLRGGKVARGGIRWSDRREDFRTEILGLMKAQMVKNAVIVPVGSKGGFVVKRPPAPVADPQANREALGAEVVACYKTLMFGLLDLTDNLKDGKVVPPPRTVRKDGDDPYLVVAADKGTATFSDIANGVARDYGFWLDDAFASGGSAGYDHKKMGITARGAWEAVKRHFRELGTDIQSQDFTVVGIGDMAGDVFGNGMLLSPHTCLVGAFNHLHIFIDPTPDPAASLQERRRLFALPRSSWSDYDATLISKGGGVFDRKAKSISLTPEMRQLFGIARERVAPSELIRAMVTAPVDLLWFGGIGTFIKASSESHADAGDRANDALRVDGKAVKARVVGEGANLGVTQRGRIEYALGGGRINTDAIDNSAGVDTSDHEVNIKIALGDAVAAGDMTLKQRDALLVEMTDEVAKLVLRDNYMQTWAISIAESRGLRLLDATGRLMRALEKAGRLDRSIEFLPDDEALADRSSDGRGLTRPELAVLLSYVKISLYDDLLPSDLLDNPNLTGDLKRYFPAPISTRFADAIGRHRLKREIIATGVTNSMINRVGVTFVNDVQEKSGLSAPDVARAYIATRDAFGLRAVWEAVQALDNKVAAEMQTWMMLETRELVERCTLWFLRNGQQPIDIEATVATFKPGVERLRGTIEGLMSEDDRAVVAERQRKLTEGGVPVELAHQVALLDALFSACDIIRLAQGDGLEIDEVARIYFMVGGRYGIDWLRGTAERLPVDGHWTRLAVGAIVDDLYGHQFRLTQNVIETTGTASGAADGVIEAWESARKPMVDRAARLVDDLRAAGMVDLAMLAVANRELRALTGS